MTVFVKKKFCSNSKFYNHFIVLFILLLFLSGCNFHSKSSSKSEGKSFTPPAANDDYFQEIGKEIGIDFIHSIGDKELSNIVESSGGGWKYRP